MRHHFGDLLHRDGDYWTILPNRERYAYRIGDVPAGSKEITIVTIGKADEHWSRVATLPNLEELTLHEPTVEQLRVAGELRTVKRLRITHARPKTLEFLHGMPKVEELVLEYVSGFDDLTPVASLKRLRALHLENLRRVVDFGGLTGIETLKYLAIHGTLDWQQPIQDFEFLRGLPKLEEFALWQIISKKPYPALLPAVGLRKLKRLRVHGSYLPVQEYALLEEGLTGVEGAAWGPYRTVAESRLDLPRNDLRSRLSDEEIRAKHPDILVDYEGRRTIDDPKSRWFEFTGRAAGRAKCGSATADAKCRERVEAYAAMRRAARQLIDAQVPPKRMRK